ncbi:CCA tRNA nucleotidyltransferase 1, mitochondrial [Diprion similis]|uniref:CCA tRNA nucleotidyltransferase 1, mitochondrial n=1 Tax=Diprion similis TaxID=362088 RepID=UPI001EF82A26|nr:CCA tRNA nucleotidyltransferase 1, mitochondrial [Diprion similis]XP_046750949.1 CCA tRNA nucleotidyltransferase 1, mitochondrial [Diprion similis]
MIITCSFVKYIRHFKHSSRLVLTRGAKSYSTERWKATKMEGEKAPASRDDPVIMKLDTPEFQTIFTPELKTLAGLFEKYNYEIRIAGGAVRDILMGIRPKDLDFATTATPNEMKDMFTKEEIRMINMKGEQHGTITSRINDAENFEITTLRIDIATDGRHAKVEFTKDWKLDANRRDLTINSMFLGLDGTVYDYFFGYDDLKKRRIAFVGNAETRIQEDYLRILRYFRFYGRIAENPDNHDATTLEAIRSNVEGLDRVAGERIWTEWHKIMEGRFALELLAKMVECQLSTHIGLPEHPDVDALVEVHKRATENGVTLRPISLISALLKDEEEVMRLHGRLKLSAFDRDLALFLVQHRVRPPSEKPLKIYQKLVIMPKGKNHGIKDFVCELFRYRGELELLKEFADWRPPRFPVGGDQLKQHVKVGKIMGLVINRLKEEWIDSDFQLDSDELVKLVPNIVEEITDNIKK